MIKDPAVLLEIYEVLSSEKIHSRIEITKQKLDVSLSKKHSEIAPKLAKISAYYTTSGSRNIEILIDSSTILLFEDSSSFLDHVCILKNPLEGFHIFIWSWGGTFLVYENFSRLVAQQNRTKKGDYLVNVLQYSETIQIFLDEHYSLIELNREVPTKAMFIVSKGDEKLLVKLDYSAIPNNLQERLFEAFDLDLFTRQLAIEEWLACYKNTLCAFFNEQSESRRNFMWLYENFNYLYSATQKSYSLFVSKFSFDKVFKQFKKDQEQYFSSLNEYQNKLSGQLVTIPLTIGAALLSDNFFDNNGLNHNIYLALLTGYVVFVMATIMFVYFDLRKIRAELKQERSYLQDKADTVFEKLKSDFSFLLRKSFLMQLFAIFLLLVFIVALVAVWSTPEVPISKDKIILI